MKENSKIVLYFIVCTIIFIFSLPCYSKLFITGEMIQKDVKIESGNSTKYFFCSVDSTDLWEDYLDQDSNLAVYAPPKNYTNAAIVSVDHNKKWLIVYNHDIPFRPIVIKGEVVYKSAISYCGIIMVKEMPYYSSPYLMLIENGDIIRVFTVIIFIFWISYGYISLSEWVDERARKRGE